MATKPTAKRATKTQRLDTARIYGFIVQKEAELNAMPLDAVLTELGALVGQYTVTTWDARSGNPPGVEPESDLNYSIAYEIRRFGRPTFHCGAMRIHCFTTLHAAAVKATLGAIAWLEPSQNAEAA